MILLRNRLFILLSAAAAAAANSSPPRAHELDESYTFDQYLNHHGKDYSDPVEYNRRQQIFEKNLKMILAHNEGRMDESGEVLNGYVMGVNRFTDVDLEELPMGYNKKLHPDWSSQFMQGGDVLAMERRRLGGLESYQVCCKMLSTFVLLCFRPHSLMSLCHPLPTPLSNHPTLKWKTCQPSPKKWTGNWQVT
jgi:hypothetical protein